MVLHGFTWFYMVLHGFTWFYMVLHGFTWVCMVHNTSSFSPKENEFASLIFSPSMKYFVVLFVLE